MLMNTSISIKHTTCTPRCDRPYHMLSSVYQLISVKKRIERNRHTNYARRFLEVCQTRYLNTSSFLISLLSYSVTLNWLRRKPKNRNTNDVMEDQPVLICDKKKSEQHGKVTIRITSFVGSKIIQRLVRHAKVLYLMTP